MNHRKLLEKYMARIQYDEGKCFIPVKGDESFSAEERVELMRIAGTIPGVRFHERAV